MTRWKRLTRKLRATPAFWVATLLVTLGALSNHPTLRPTPASLAQAEDRPSLQAMNEEKPLLREGSVITESRGRFKFNEDRIVFIDESLGKSITCLENLLLQRIKSFLDDEEGTRQRWSVSGKLTEFHGENYLWLDRATRAQ